MERHPGVHSNKPVVEFFKTFCNWLNGQTELYTIVELHEKLRTFVENDDVYSIKWLKKLKERYGDSIFFAETPGLSNTVCFKDMAGDILNDKCYQDRKGSLEEEQIRVIRAAANLIKNEIRCTQCETDSHPSLNDIETKTSILPPSQMQLMECLIGNPLKQASIGQCLLKAMKPNSVIPPVLFVLGVEIDHAIGSKSLLIELSKPGCSISYDEVKRYKQSLMMSESTLPTSVIAGFTQFVADNVDHNVSSLDGRETCHCMGIIACSIEKQIMSDQRIKKLANVMKSSDIAKRAGVKLHWYTQPAFKALSKIKFTSMKHLINQLPSSSSELAIDILWHGASIFRKAKRQGPRPNYNGFIENITAGCRHPERSTITTLPLIDLNPGDESCIYSTLLHIKDLAESKGIPTPSITFDQPLWLKAVEIVSSKKPNFVVRLGGFHYLMSCVGSVGATMEVSGLQKLLQKVLGTNTVSHMTSGKAISRTFEDIIWWILLCI